MSAPRSAEAWAAARAALKLATAAGAAGLREKEDLELRYAAAYAQLATAAAVAESSQVPLYATRWNAAALLPEVTANRDLVEANLDTARGNPEASAEEVQRLQDRAYELAEAAAVLQAAAEGDPAAVGKIRDARYKARPRYGDEL